VGVRHDEQRHQRRDRDRVDQGHVPRLDAAPKRPLRGALGRMVA
jgi:hypothetical protein